MPAAMLALALLSAVAACPTIQSNQTTLEQLQTCVNAGCGWDEPNTACYDCSAAPVSNCYMFGCIRTGTTCSNMTAAELACYAHTSSTAHCEASASGCVWSTRLALFPNGYCVPCAQYNGMPSAYCPCT